MQFNVITMQLIYKITKKMEFQKVNEEAKRLSKMENWKRKALRLCALLPSSEKTTGCKENNEKDCCVDEEYRIEESSLQVLIK